MATNICFHKGTSASFSQWILHIGINYYVLSFFNTENETMFCIKKYL